MLSHATTWMEILSFSIVHKRKNYGIFSLVFQFEKLILTAQPKGVLLHFPQEKKPTRFKLYGYDVISLSSEGKFGFKNIQTHLKKFMLNANKFVEIVWTTPFLLCSFTKQNGIIVKLSIHLSKICAN